MKLLLVADIGNTQTAVGLWDSAQLVAKWRLASRTHQTADEIGALLWGLLRLHGLEFPQIQGAALASVVPPLESRWMEAVHKYIGKPALRVGREIPPPMPIRYRRPHELGADRLVNGYAGHRLFGGPLIVVDYGTATTFDCVSREGAYLGGAIAPGLLLGAQALARGTAKLPAIDPRSLPPSPIAQETEEAIENGLIWGQVGLTKEMAERIKGELGPETRVIATGGLATAIAPHCRVIEEVVPDLTLMGLGWLGWEALHPR